MFQSTFANRRQRPVPSTRNQRPIVRQDMRGLDMVTPYSAILDNRAPFGKNFRVYAEEADARRVSIQDRRGSAEYTKPLGEAQSGGDESTTNLADELVGKNEAWKGMKFSPTKSGPLTMLELYLQNDGKGSGPLIVEVREDDDGTPGRVIADSGIYGSALPVDEYDYVPVRFIEAPQVTNTDDYWVVAYIQEDGSGTYLWGSNDDSALAVTSTTTGLDWQELGASLLHKVHVADNADIKGIYRFTPEDGDNVTIVAIGTNMYKVNNDNEFESIASGLNANATEYFFDFADGKVFWVNGFDDLRTWDGTTVEVITHSQLPILKYMTFHKNSLMGIAADERNKLIWSEQPLNDDGDDNFWYEAYLSTSFEYIPNPKAKDPITGIVSFQDSLHVFTRTDKQVMYGDNAGNFRIREALGRKGAISQRSIHVDENYIYFLSDDGVYRYDGSSDEIISDRVQPEIEGIANEREAFMTKWKRQVRLFYASALSPVNNRCLIWHTVLEEWEMDTDTYVKFALPLTDGDDPRDMLEGSSVAPTLTRAEKSRDNLGKPVDFEYHCKNDSMDNPAVRKRIVKFFPMLEGEGGNYNVKVGVDRDLQGTTRYFDFPLETAGIKIGSFLIGDGTKLGRIFSFAPERIRVSGYGYFWQVRIKKRAINNPVKFNGYVLAIKTKRL